MPWYYRRQFLLNFRHPTSLADSGLQLSGPGRHLSCTCGTQDAMHNLIVLDALRNLLDLLELLIDRHLVHHEHKPVEQRVEQPVEQQSGAAS